MTEREADAGSGVTAGEYQRPVEEKEGEAGMTPDRLSIHFRCGRQKMAPREQYYRHYGYSAGEIRQYLDLYHHLREAVLKGCAFITDQRQIFTGVKANSTYRGIEANRLLLAHADITRSLDQLPQQLQRQAQLWTEGYTQFEAARETGVSQSTVSRLRGKIVRNIKSFLNRPVSFAEPAHGPQSEPDATSAVTNSDK